MRTAPFAATTEAAIALPATITNTKSKQENIVSHCSTSHHLPLLQCYVHQFVCLLFSFFSFTTNSLTLTAHRLDLLYIFTLYVCYKNRRLRCALKSYTLVVVTECAQIHIYIPYRKSVYKQQGTFLTPFLFSISTIIYETTKFQSMIIFFNFLNKTRIPHFFTFF